MSTLLVKIEESVSINGKTRGSSISNEIANVDRVYHQVLNPGTVESRVVSFGATAGYAAGEMISGDLRYLRITNINSSAAMSLLRVVGTDEAYAVELNQNESFVLFNDTLDAFTGATAATASIGATAAAYITASGNAIIEVFAASDGSV
jgi:hypothetical protein